MSHEIQLLIIPILGVVKNYIKYKNISLTIFLRTPFINYIFMRILITNNPYISTKDAIYASIVYERYFFFILKIFLSWWYDDYHTKKEKYKIKYGLEY